MSDNLCRCAAYPLGEPRRNTEPRTLHALCAPRAEQRQQPGRFAGWIQTKLPMNQSIKTLAILSVTSRGSDAGLLVLRLLAGASLFLKHGWEKLAHFAAMSAHFQDPVHIGPVPSLVIALVSDAVCAALTILGLATRGAALFVMMNVGVAWALVHRFAFFTGPAADHGELCVLYFAVFLTLLLTGAGRYSLDELIASKPTIDHLRLSKLFPTRS